MKTTDDWRVKALGDGLAIAPGLFARFRDQVLEGRVTDPYTRLVICRSMTGSLRALFPMLYGGAPSNIDAVLGPVDDQLNDFNRWLGRELGVLHLEVVRALGPPEGLSKATATIGSELHVTARGYPEPAPYWTGALLGLVLATFEEVGLKKPEVHVMADADDMRAALVELATTGEIVEAGVSLKPTQH